MGSFEFFCNNENCLCCKSIKQEEIKSSKMNIDDIQFFVKNKLYEIKKKIYIYKFAHHYLQINNPVLNKKIRKLEKKYLLHIRILYNIENSYEFNDNISIYNEIKYEQDQFNNEDTKDEDTKDEDTEDEDTEDEDTEDTEDEDTEDEDTEDEDTKDKDSNKSSEDFKKSSENSNKSSEDSNKSSEDSNKSSEDENLNINFNNISHMIEKLMNLKK
jgi:hypothetical protein